MLTLVAEGLTNSEICDRLWLFMPTVKTHIANSRRPAPATASSSSSTPSGPGSRPSTGEPVRTWRSG
nr:LuxR C-terminal-related transcriptional regulator [Pseudonocardia kunmingensis]